MSSCHAPDSLATPVQDSTDAESFTSAVDMDLVAGDELSIVGGTKRAGGCPSAGHVGGSAVASPSATARTVADDKVACTSPHWTLASPQSGRLAAWTAVLLLGGSRPMAWSCSSDANLGAPTDRTDEPHAQPLTALLDPATSAKIRCDTHRTFRGHRSFEERVGEEALQELLEAFASDVEEGGSSVVSHAIRTNWSPFDRLTFINFPNQLIEC